MRLQWNGTSAVTIKVQPNDVNVTLLPGNVVDVPQNQYQSLKDIYGTNFKEVGNDTANQMVVKSFTATQIKALSTAPIQLISAPGAGYAIVIDEIISSLDFVAAAYATNTDLEIRYDNAAAGDAGGAEATVDSLDAILLSTASAVYRTPGLGAALDTALTINKGITAKVKTGDPATGDSPVKLRVYYRIVSVS